VWPDRFPLLARISATDELARGLKSDGVDLIDCSSGGNVHGATCSTGTAGFITSAQQADHIIRNRQADLVIVGRQALRDPGWPLHVAAELHAEIDWTRQYLRAKA
jgi:2,4-dienoyl-CoA reductase-like NADH-dependent reductase (Old Yellow Enzyme family)